MTSSESALRASEIKKALLEQIDNYEKQLEVEEVGQVLEVKDGVARIWGLSSCVANEMLEITSSKSGEKVTALASNLEEDNIGAVILGDYLKLREGDPVSRTGRVLSVPAGPAMLGRVVDALGQPTDGRGPIETSTFMKVDRKAPGIVYRQPVDQPLQTGVKAIDSMIPIGRGQRELIIGDRGTGKTAVAIDAIINQKDTGVICVYNAIGQKGSTVASIAEKLREHGALEYTVIVAASASEPAPMQFMSPYGATAIGEYFMYHEGKDVLCVYDDLSKQADAYREASLILRRPPGREAYPGDVFYLHSRLLERAAKISDDADVVASHPDIHKPGGSLTALPIIQTQAGDVSAYIPTNVISITDGQIFLETNLFYSGIRPAVNVGLSVSRVGGNAQIKGMKKVAGRLRLDLAQFRALEAFAQFGTELDAATQSQLDRGSRVVEILKQGQYEPVPVENQVMVIFAATQGYLDGLEVDDVRSWEEGFLEYMAGQEPEVGKAIASEGQISDETEAALRKALDFYVGVFRAGTESVAEEREAEAVSA
ncbi:MAG: F0F1 ATP synthase subunit alpha [Gemmatimonadota bacterium]|nr:F0F1 ATP synthase subunit alpha [Gemmatimonadota bacterium]